MLDWRRSLHKRRTGFTLVELLVGLAISSIVLLSIGKTFSISNRTYVSQDQITYAEQNLRGAIEIMAYELRMAGYVPINNLEDGDNEITSDVSGQSWSDGSFDRIELATANAIALAVDLNPDDDPGTTEYAETVMYNLIGTTLTRQSWQWNEGSMSWVADAANPATVAENITNLGFIYTFKDGTSGIPAEGSLDFGRDDVRAVTLSISGTSARPVKIRDTVSVPLNLTMQSVVMMRNMDLDPTVSQSY